MGKWCLHASSFIFENLPTTDFDREIVRDH